MIVEPKGEPSSAAAPEVVRPKAKHSWHSPALSARYGELPYDEPRYKPRIRDADQGDSERPLSACALQVLLRYNIGTEADHYQQPQCMLQTSTACFFVKETHPIACALVVCLSYLMRRLLMRHVYRKLACI